MKRILFMIICGGWMTLIPGHAQQDTAVTNRVVVVENEYSPIIMDASKLNVLPQVEEPSVPKSEIDYVTSVQPVHQWEYQIMNLLSVQEKQNQPLQGYVSGAMGNRNNVDIRAGYLWKPTQEDCLQLDASLKGWNGDVDGVDDGYWKSRFYQTEVGAEYSHRFGKLEGSVGGSFGSQVFNFMPDIMENTIPDKQHHTIGNIHVGIATVSKEVPFVFQAEAGYNYFNRKYDVPTMLEEMRLMGKGNELNPYFNGWVGMFFKENQQLAMAFDVNYYSYSFPYVKNSASLELNPYYATQGENWKLHLGAHLDAWKKGEGKLNFAPDVQVDYLFSDSYVLYARAGGGRTSQSLREITAELTPYWAFSQSDFTPLYISLDASVGLKASPTDGIWFHLTGGYQIREDDICMNLDSRYTYMYVGLNQTKTKATYGSAELKYDYKDRFILSAKGTYYNWSAEENEEWCLAMKPELEISFYTEGRLVGGWLVGIGYDYAKRCNETYNHVSNLYAKGAYRFRQNLELFVQGRNLLGSEYCGTDGYPVQGLNFLVGAAFRF